MATVNILILSRNQNWKSFVEDALDGSKFNIRFTDPDITYLGDSTDGLLLLDLDLAEKESLPALLYQLRSTFGWMRYIIGLSASNNICRSRLLDFVHAGVDDILEDSYDQNILKAKLSAIARRQNHELHLANEAVKYSLSIPEKLVYVDGQPVKVTGKAFTLFLFLYMNTDYAFSREDIYRHVWSVGKGFHSRTLDTHISTLKRDLQLDGSFGLSLQSIYNFGYKLEVVRCKAAYPPGSVEFESRLS